MKNNKGFISMSIVYSFFLVFTLLLILIMSTYVNNRLSFSAYKNDIKSDVFDESLLPSSLTNLKDYCSISTNTTLLSCWLFNNKTIFLKETSVDGEHYAYRFVGSSPTNYACFGTNKDCFNPPAGTLPENISAKMLEQENYQYRIVGIFDGYYLGLTPGKYYVKMVRNNSKATATYTSFTKNVSYAGLSAYSGQIISAKWYSCINSGTKNRTLFWQKESPKGCASAISGQINLLYASDFGYSSSTIGDFRILTSTSTFSSTSTWLYKGSEWLASPSSGTTYLWTINSSGGMSSIKTSTTNNIRPALYLNYNMKYKTGSGMSSSDGITFGV